MSIKTLISIIEKRSPIPVLGLVKVANHKATSTDADIYITVPTKIRKHGLYYPKGLPTGVEVLSEMPIADFPEPKVLHKPVGKLVIDKTLADLIGWIAKAASTEETRYYLNGLYFDASGIVATDGHRLHMVENVPTKWKGKARPVIVPNKTIKAMLALFKETKVKTMTVEFYEDAVTVTAGDAFIQSKIIDGTFPDYRKVIPDIKKNRAAGRVTDFNAEEIRAILPTLKVLADDKSLGVKFEDGKLHTGSGYLEARSWDVSTKTKRPIGFNAQYLADLNSGKLYYDETHGPNVVKSKVADYDVTGVLMPLRV